MGEESRFMTRTECAARAKEMTGGITEVKEALGRHGLALYGEDGRGGIQHDITVTKEAVERIEEKVNGGITVNHTLTGGDWAKIIVAVITTAGIVGVAILQFVIPALRGG